MAKAVYVSSLVNNKPQVQVTETSAKDGAWTVKGLVASS